MLVEMLFISCVNRWRYPDACNIKSTQNFNDNDVEKNEILYIEPLIYSLLKVV